MFVFGTCYALDDSVQQYRVGQNVCLGNIFYLEKYDCCMWLSLPYCGYGAEFTLINNVFIEFQIWNEHIEYLLSIRARFPHHAGQHCWQLSRDFSFPTV